MEIIASLREQLDRLCANPSVESTWILRQLSCGLRERYGALAVGFLRQGQADVAQLLGLCGLDGEVLIPLSDDFRADSRHPQTKVGKLSTETWLPTTQFSGWQAPQVDDCVTGCRSAFLAPWLVDKPADWHMLILSPIAAPEYHRQDRGLSVSANLLATNLLRALDARRLAQANSWIEREMDEIARLQRLLQPEQRIELAGVDVAFSSHIYHYAGGDYFDVPRLTHLVPEAERVAGADHFGAVIADVSGHGPSAAVEAAMLDAIMRTYPGPVGRGPEAVADYLNRYLFTRRPRAAFITAFLCNYHPRERELRYVNCGHPPPLIRTADGQCSELEVPTDIPLRIVPGFQWTRATRLMASGDALVLFTDGVTESRSPAGKELGARGLQELVQSAQGDAQAMLDHLEAGINAHLDGHPRQDDQTLIVLKFG